MFLCFWCFSFILWIYWGSFIGLLFFFCCEFVVILLFYVLSCFFSCMRLFLLIFVLMNVKLFFGDELFVWFCEFLYISWLVVDLNLLLLLKILFFNFLFLFWFLLELNLFFVVEVCFNWDIKVFLCDIWYVKEFIVGIVWGGFLGCVCCSFFLVLL